MSEKIKVLVIDDSALIRMLLTKALSESEQIEVVGAAEDPIVARKMIKSLNPDVLTLDIEMPKMDGLTFLKNLMRLRPMPVVMISTLTKKGAVVTLKALEYGAVDFIAKPDSDIRENLMIYSAMICEKVIAASNAKLDTSIKTESILSDKSSNTPNNIKIPQPVLSNSSIQLITIGASTGGTEAIKAVLMNLPPNLPPIVITQHIPPVFSTSFAKRMNESSSMVVIEPTETMQLDVGHAYIAPGGLHMKVTNNRGKLFLTIEDTEPVNRHKPSVEVLFDSVNASVGKHSLGVILTGMGADGAEALKRLKDTGAHTIAQDEESSVVWGMPGATVKIGGATEILPLNRIATRLVDLVAGK